MEARARIPVGPPSTRPLPSYWHSTKSPLAAVIEPEAENPAPPYSYAIIGSGISGAMTAYYLLKAHVARKDGGPSPRIVMLEAREICSGATGRNGGHTKAASYRTYAQHREEYGKEEALRIGRLEWENIVGIHELAKELEIECESSRCDTVDLVYDQGTFEAGKRAIDVMREDASEEERQPGGMAWYQVYEKSDAIEQKFWVRGKKTNPAMQDSAIEEFVGAFQYAAGRINAYKFSTGILKECVKMGLQLCANTPVHSILPTSPPIEREKQMYDVFTQYNTIQARNVIVATNGYTPYLLKELQGAIVPLRGQITTQQPPKTAAHPSALPCTYSFIYRSGYEYMISRNEPDGTQHIIIGGGLGRLPEGGACEFGTVDDSRLNPSVSSYLQGTLNRYFDAPEADDIVTEEEKESSEYKVIQEWTGIMGATADGLPFVGPVPGSKGLWISAGFNGHGMVLCLKSAEALVGMITEDKGVSEWFPESFLASSERIERSRFRGRTDMQVPETGGAAIEDGGG
jgi:glycine/D-amino acid oxidase-like deaminating enzyme